MKKDQKAPRSSKAPVVNILSGAEKTSPSKKAKGKDKVKQANLEKAGKDASKKVADREVKYAYPTDCNTASKKKVFRRNARAAARRFDKAISALKTSKEKNAKVDLEKLKKDQATFVKQTYTAVAAKA